MLRPPKKPLTILLSSTFLLLLATQVQSCSSKINQLRADLGINSSSNVSVPQDNSSSTMSMSQDNGASTMSMSQDNGASTMSMSQDNSSSTMSMPRASSSSSSSTASMLKASSSSAASTSDDNSSSAASTSDDNSSSTNTNSEIAVLTKQAPNLNPEVLKLALTAYNKARSEGLDSKQILTVINYNLPDSQKRLWIFDLANNQLLYNTLVAHGQGSGGVHATRFSNSNKSHETSLGVYITKNTYLGKHGFSLRVAGLEKGINNNALNRDIVFHSAWYVSPELAKDSGRIGRSWGCFALNKKMSGPVINAIKDGTLVFAYAPNAQWLDNSVFLNS